MSRPAIEAQQRRNAQDRAEERSFVYDLRISGHSIRNIAVLATGHFGYNISATKVHELLQEETEQRHRPKWEAFRDWELDRTDRLLLALEPRILAGDPQAIGTAVRVIDRRCRLLGLDAPTRVDATVTETSQQDLELQELLNEARARHATRAAEIKGGS